MITLKFSVHKLVEFFYLKSQKIPTDVDKKLESYKIILNICKVWYIKYVCNILYVIKSILYNRILLSYIFPTGR